MRTEFERLYMQEWQDTNDYVFSRQQVYKLFEERRISRDKAEYLLRLRYELTRSNKLRVRDGDNSLVDLDEIRYYLALL